MFGLSRREKATKKAYKSIKAKDDYSPSMRQYVLKKLNFDLNSIPGMDSVYSFALLTIEKQTGKDISDITYPEFGLATTLILRGNESHDYRIYFNGTLLDKSAEDGLLACLFEILANYENHIENSFFINAKKKAEEAVLAKSEVELETHMAFLQNNGV
jgi:hypothetical protein